jgi:Ca2+-binding EF-hand superfamily protein
MTFDEDGSGTIDKKEMVGFINQILPKTSKKRERKN